MAAADYTPEEEEQIFQAAAALPPAERHTYLDSACAGRHGLRGAIERLLATLSDEKFMQRAADRTETVEMAGELARFKPEEAGETIGSYKLLQRIGEGGFGVVWMAEQEKPVRRRVALKIIKLGMDTKEVVARFDQERQALALMDHPNIARVIDAGATPLGRPYFAMELVRGVKITEYCDEANLCTVDRLKLFMTVCHAVQHAHQKGIIHRDLKPSNILVTLHDGVAVPKVIDFGVAKATQQQRLTDLTLFTQFEQMIGTPLYMSPEQAELSGLDIDTRSDIYSLGVLLYELLTGRTPFDPQELIQKGLDEVRRVIREQEPQKPSTFISTMAVERRTVVAKHRQSEADKLVGTLRGDLDWIVMKALEKDRTRRYETANGLARDIERHLLSETVQARPATKLYRFRRMVRRNQVAFAAVTAVVTVLIIGLSISLWMFFKERHARERAVSAEKLQDAEREKAEIAAQKSEQVASFLKRMLAGVGPSVANGRDTAILRDVLDATVVELRDGLKRQPEVVNDLRQVIAEVYLLLGEFAKSDDVFQDVLAYKRSKAGADAEVAAWLEDYGMMLKHQFLLHAAEKCFREAAILQKQLRGAECAEVGSLLNEIAYMMARQGKAPEAETMAREALLLNKKLFGDNHPKVADSLKILADAATMQGRLKEAESLCREVLTSARANNAVGHLLMGPALLDLTKVWLKQDKLPDAESEAKEAIAILRHNDESWELANCLYFLAVIVEKLGRPQEAELFHQEALAISMRVHGLARLSTRNYLRANADFLKARGREKDAQILLQNYLIKAKQELGSEHVVVGELLAETARSGVPGASLAQVEREALLRQALENQRRGGTQNFKAAIETVNALSEILDSQGKSSEADELQKEALDNARCAEDRGTLVGQLWTAGRRLYHTHSRYAEAEPMYREICELRRTEFGPDSEQTLIPMVSFAQMLTDWAWAGRVQADGATGQTSGGTAQSRSPHDVAREAENLLLHVTNTRLRDLEPGNGRIHDARGRLGGAMVAVAFTDSELSADARDVALAKAEAILLEADAAIRANAPDDVKTMRDSVGRLARLYDAWGKPLPDELAKWRQELAKKWAALGK